MGLPRHLEIPFLSTVELFVEKEIEKAERDSFDETILSEEKQNALIEQWEVNNEEIRKEEGNRTNSHQKESENEFSDKIKNEELKQQNDLDEEEINILAEKINSLLPEKTNQFVFILFYFFLPFFCCLFILINLFKLFLKTFIHA